MRVTTIVVFFTLILILQETSAYRERYREQDSQEPSTYRERLRERDSDDIPPETTSYRDRHRDRDEVTEPEPKSYRRQDTVQRHRDRDSVVMADTSLAPESSEYRKRHREQAPDAVSNQDPSAYRERYRDRDSPEGSVTQDSTFRERIMRDRDSDLVPPQDSNTYKERIMRDRDSDVVPPQDSNTYRDRLRDQEPEAMASINTYETMVPPPSSRYSQSSNKPKRPVPTPPQSDEYSPRPSKHGSSYNRGGLTSEPAYTTAPAKIRNKPPPKEEPTDTEEAMTDVQTTPAKVLLPRITIRHDGPQSGSSSPSQECRKCGGFTFGITGTCCQACGKLGYNKGCWCRQCDCLCYDT